MSPLDPKMFSRILAFWSLLLISAAASALEERSDALVQALQKGGYVIFIRHAGTNRDHKDTDIRDLTNCTTQRNLTERGREQSKLIGEGFAALGIPVGEVLTSEYCRCFDTAQIAFGRATRVKSLSSYIPVPPAEKQQRVQSIRRMLNTLPSSGSNTVIVSHHEMFRDASGIALVEGEAAIFKPTPTGSQLIARIVAEGWPSVVKQYLATHAAPSAR